MSILDRFSLVDRVGIVTGAGRGIGAASAVGLAQAGADVAICARTESQLEAVAEQVSAAGRKALVIAADLSDPDAPARVAAQTAEHFGRIDVLVNNVGGTFPSAFMDTGSDALNAAFDFNVTTAHRLTQAAVPHLLEQRGSIINITSAIGRVAGRGYLAYGTVKAALAHYTRLAAHDLAPRIRVNGIAPGAIATSAMEIVAGDDGLRGQVESAALLGRLGEPEEIAATVVYLASQAGSFITGKVLEVDGGCDRNSLELGLPDL